MPERLTCPVKAGSNTIYDHSWKYWSRYRLYKPSFATARLRQDPVKRNGPSLVNFEDKVIYVLGGQDNRKKGNS